MKAYLFAILLCVAAGQADAAEFLQAPVVPDAQIMLKSNSRLELRTDMSHDEIVDFYRAALKNVSNIKFRNWQDSTYIEDDGNRKWHSITISKEDVDGKTSVVIAKDSWTWIIGTLVLRYVGVFVVLVLLMSGMLLSGAIISRFVGKQKNTKE